MYGLKDGKADVIARKYINDIRKEIFRKSIHLCSALIPSLLLWSKAAVLWTLCAVLILYCIAEWLRIKGHSVFVVSKITETAARARDGDRFVLGPVTLALGILCTAFFFELPAAAIGIYALAFGDGLASLSGKLFGMIILPCSAGKTVMGSLTCFTAIFISSWAVSGNSFASLMIAIAGTVIELIPLKDIDNLLIPFILAFAASFCFGI
ncbi:phosphatidate cytidylyltransferase [Treponema sp. HNW]|uniref:diacylglycerol/polyprenol kinase family protein n=1 Tax=Treponema sp. HNW TaxID=3116654 RepID=UPI003D11C85A